MIESLDQLRRWAEEMNEALNRKTEEILRERAGSGSIQPISPEANVAQADTVILTPVLERDSAIEQQLGVKFEGLTAWWQGEQQGNTAFVLGELRTVSGSNLKQDTIVQVTAYDNTGHILGWNSTAFKRATFCARDTFQIGVALPARPSKLCVFPKKNASAITQVDRIERLEMIEERLGVRLDGLAADWNPTTGFLEAYAGLYAADGTNLRQEVDIVAVAYDEAGRVLGSTRQMYFSARFAGFATFHSYITCSTLPARVRIYPEAR
jgi:hypothetical protein